MAWCRQVTSHYLSQCRSLGRNESIPCVAMFIATDLEWNLSSPVIYLSSSCVDICLFKCGHSTGCVEDIIIQVLTAEWIWIWWDVPHTFCDRILAHSHHADILSQGYTVMHNTVGACLYLLQIIIRIASFCNFIQVAKSQRHNFTLISNN